MDLKLDDKKLEEILSAAILAQLGDEGRERIMREAVTHLLAPQSTGYGGRPESPIERAFHAAISSVANKLAFEMLEQDETLKAQIRSLLADAAAKVFGEQREKLVERLASAFADGLVSR